MGYSEILDKLVIPRPNGSEGFYETAAFIKSWLENRGFFAESHFFSLRPYMLEIIGATVILLAVFFTYLAVKRRSPAALFFPLVLGLILVMELIVHVPTVSRLHTVEAENILVHFHPRGMEHEVIISAHYDTKTEIFDHHSRSIIISLGLVVMAVWVFVAAYRWVSFRRGRIASRGADIFQKTVLCLALAFWMIVGLAFGGGFLREPSPGAVDNAASVAVLMLLAEEIDSLSLERTGVTLAFFAGEELNMQGSRAYVEDRFYETGEVSVYNINLELLCQEGKYALWREDGDFIRKIETSPEINAVLKQAVFNVTGGSLLYMPESFAGLSDSGSFLAAGIPSATISNIGSEELGTRFLHTSLDSRERIWEERITEAVSVLRESLLIMEQSIDFGDI